MPSFTFALPQPSKLASALCSDCFFFEEQLTCLFKSEPVKLLKNQKMLYFISLFFLNLNAFADLSPDASFFTDDSGAGESNAT